MFHAVDGLERAARMDDQTEDRETRGLVKQCYAEERREAHADNLHARQRDVREQNRQAQRRFQEQRVRVKAKLKEFAETRISQIDEKNSTAAQLKTVVMAANRHRAAYRRMLDAMRTDVSKRLLDELKAATLKKLRNETVEAALTQSLQQTMGVNDIRQRSVEKLLKRQMKLQQQRDEGVHFEDDELPALPHDVGARADPAIARPTLTPSRHDVPGGSRQPRGQPPPRSLTSTTHGGFRAEDGGQDSPCNRAAGGKMDVSSHHRARAMQQGAALEAPTRIWESPRLYSSQLIVPLPSLPTDSADVPYPEANERLSQSKRVDSRNEEYTTKSPALKASHHARKMASERKNFVAWALSDATKRQTMVRAPRSKSPMLQAASSGIASLESLHASVERHRQTSPADTRLLEALRFSRRGDGSLPNSTTDVERTANAAIPARRWLRLFRQDNDRRIGGSLDRAETEPLSWTTLNKAAARPEDGGDEHHSGARWTPDPLGKPPRPETRSSGRDSRGSRPGPSVGRGVHRGSRDDGTMAARTEVGIEAVSEGVLAFFTSTEGFEILNSGVDDGDAGQGDDDDDRPSSVTSTSSSDSRSRDRGPAFEGEEAADGGDRSLEEEASDDEEAQERNAAAVSIQQTWKLRSCRFARRRHPANSAEQEAQASAATAECTYAALTIQRYWRQNGAAMADARHRRCAKRRASDQVMQDERGQAAVEIQRFWKRHEAVQAKASGI